MISIEKIAQITGHKGSIFSLRHQDADHFLSAGGEGWIVAWQLSDLDPGRLIARVESNIFSLFQKGQTIIAGDMNGGLHWIDLDKDETIDLQHHRKGIFGIWEEGNSIFALGGDGYLSKRPFDDPKSVESVQISHQALRCQVSINDNTCAVGSSDGCIYFLDPKDLSVRKVINDAHGNSIFTLAYDASRQQIWSGGRDAQIKVWDIAGNPVETIAGHMFTVNALAFNTDKSLLFSGSRDKTIKVWNADTLELIKVIEGIRDDGHLNSVNSLLWCPDQDYLISGSDDKSIGIWKIEKTAHDII